MTKQQQHDCVQVDAIKATQIDVAVLKTNNVTMVNDIYLEKMMGCDPLRILLQAEGVLTLFGKIKF
jgi:hypothetical protein